MLNFICIIVLYNVYYLNSDSYKSLLKTEQFENNQLKIILVDNSTLDCQNQSSASLDNHYYISMNGNKGISKAYNAALSLLEKEGYIKKSNLIILLDDDTKLNKDYFNEIVNKYNCNIDIYLPIVYDEIGILSPSIMGIRCKRCKTIQQVNAKNICGINSGMVINAELFKSYRYDERIFLDYIDHQFIRDMKQQGKKIALLNSELFQHFSSNNDNYEQTVHRFKIMKHDLKIFYSRNVLDKFVYAYVIIRRKIGILIKFKKISILSL